MPSVCFYFQLHQPLRLKRYSVFDSSAEYFDDKLNTEVLSRVVDKCYDPATKLLADMLDRYDGRFRFSMSITGVLLEQLAQHHPHIIERLAALSDTGLVEFLGETYYHSLAFLYSRDEFRQQIDLHSDLIEELFGQRPTVFRNTELIYNNDMAHYIAGLDRFQGVLTEGVDRILDGRSPNQLYQPPHTDGLSVMLRNYRLSDDIAFRFSNKDWPHYPLTTAKFADWVDELNDERKNLCNLFVDFETFGEHQWADTGIMDFLADLPEAVLSAGRNDFRTISDVLDTHDPIDTIDCPNMISWADTERDLSAWLGNAMQSNALHELFKLEKPVKDSGDEHLLADWRRMTISDHFYYMCTKYFEDAAVHDYFNPYESPYDSYITFMNVLDNLRTRLN